MSVDTQVGNNSIRWPRVTVLRASVVAATIATSVAVAGLWSADATSAPAGAPVSATDQAAVAGFARANALSGLSPASLRTFAAQPSLADYAKANGLTGLPPASLAPIAAPANP